MIQDSTSPIGLPALPRRILVALLHQTRYASFVAELDDLFTLRLGRDGLSAARRWYRWQVLAAPAQLGWHQLTGSSPRNMPKRPVRPAPRAPLLDGVQTDARRAMRRLVRQPAYTVASILTIGIGVAAIASVYSIANWMLLRPVPAVHSPNELATIQLEGAAPFGLPISNPDYRELSRNVSATPDLAAYTAQQFNLSVDPASNPERTSGEVVTANYFTTLGVTLAVGRGFDQSHASPAGGLAVVISDRLWQRYWSRAPAAVGQRIIVNGQPFTIVGVAPRQFHGAELPGRAEIWAPAGTIPTLLHNPAALQAPSDQIWQTLIARIPTRAGRLRAGSEFARAVAVIRDRKGMSSFMAIDWAFKVHEGIGLQPLVRTAVQHTLTILLAASLLFLLLTCANVANLGLTRALSLSSSTAVQRLLGAPLARVIRERLTESIIIGLFSAFVGAVFTVLATRIVRGAGVAGVELDYSGIIIDGRVIAATAGVAILAGVLAGLLPALAVRRSDGSQLIRVAHRRDRRSSRIRQSMVIAQVALSTTLVIGSGLLTRTLTNLRQIDVGFVPDQVLTFTLDPELQGYSEVQTAQLIDRLLKKFDADTRVTSAGVSHALGVFSDRYFVTVFPRPGTRDERDQIVARSLSVSPSFLPTLGISVVGPGFNHERSLLPDSTAEPVGILNETALRVLLPGTTADAAIGRMVTPVQGAKPIRVVGVARDARLSRVITPTEPYVFRPWPQGFRDKEFSVVLRSRVPTAELEAAIRGMVRAVDPALPVYGLRAMRAQLDDLFSEQRLVATLGTMLGTVGIVLSALGLYALLAQSVLERRREIGIRLALGARPEAVIRSVIGGGLGMTAAGMLVGVAGAAYLSRLIASRLFGVAPFDVATYAGASALLLVAALGACGLPARRASKVEIVEALRAD